MSNLKQIRYQKSARKVRSRGKIFGTKERPRLSVHVSHRHINAQLIDDSTSTTFTSISSVGKKNIPSNMTEKAKWIGEEIGKNALKAKIKKVTFDRNGRLYHGRIKTLAEAARKTGLDF